MRTCWPPIYCRVPFLRGPGQLFGISLGTLKKRSRCFIRTVLLLFLCVLFALWIGMTVQDKKTNRAPSTLYFYQKPHVCGIILPDGYKRYANRTNSSRTNTNLPPPPLIRTKTFDSEEQARNETAENVIVGHCGDCGACSNPHDILIYDNTRNTMMETAKGCAKRGVFFGRKVASKCMEREVGFSTECNKCWIENMMCDVRLCLFTCMWNGVFSRPSTQEEGRHELNSCTKCDEMRCGPAFIECAGANRRRTGILSDIERNNDQEVCDAVDKEWWRREGIQQYYRLTQGQQEPRSAVQKSIPPHSRHLRY